MRPVRRSLWRALAVLRRPLWLPLLRLARLLADELARRPLLRLLAWLLADGLARPLPRRRLLRSGSRRLRPWPRPDLGGVLARRPGAWLGIDRGAQLGRAGERHARLDPRRLGIVDGGRRFRRPEFALGQRALGAARAGGGLLLADRPDSGRRRGLIVVFGRPGRIAR